MSNPEKATPDEIKEQVIDFAIHMPEGGRSWLPT